MNKLLGLFLLWIVCLVPSLANSAALFAVCTTACTWDNTSTTMWSTLSGGATGAGPPTSADTVTLDAATCVGGTTCTITPFAGTISASTITMSACTASTTGCILDASANNTNFTLSGANAFTSTGSGTRTLNMGNGTWTLSNAAANWNVASATNFTLNANSSTIAFTGTGIKQFNAGTSRTYNIVTINGGASSFVGVNATTALTIGTLTITPPQRMTFSSGVTNTITTFTDITGTSSQQVSIINSNQLFAGYTISSANNFTCTWCAILGGTFSGGGTFTAPNSFNLGGNSGITITAPSGGGGRIIGG